MGIWTQLQEPTRNETIAVGAASVVIAYARNTDQPRKVISIRNTSPNAADTISITQGLRAAAVGTGIVLKQGEGYTDSQDSMYEPWQGTITAICATANGTLAIFER